MEPHDNNNQHDFNKLDKLIREKLGQDISLHEREIESSKSFIWSAIQRKTSEQKSLAWFHLAAAVIVLVIVFSFFFLKIQQDHQQELQLLTNRIESIQKYYSDQESTLLSKEAEINTLSSQIDELQIQMTGMGETSNSVEIKEVERVVYHTDTVYVSEIRYVTASNPDQSNLLPDSEKPSDLNIITSVTSHDVERDDEIFPSQSTQKSIQSPESIQLKFGAFASNKD